MSGSSADAVRLIAGLVTHMQQIVGDGACYAMLHYGAMEEGKRFGTTTPGPELARILARIDHVLGQRSEVLSDSGAEVRIRIHSSPLVDTGQRALHGVILGLIEGGLLSARRTRYKGTLAPGPAQGELLLHLKREA